MYVAITNNVLDLMSDDIVCIQTSVETKEVLDYLKDSFHDIQLEDQTTLDIPREKLIVNDRRIKTFDELKQLWGHNKHYNTLLLFTNQALISYPYILFQKNAENHLIAEIREPSAMIINLHTDRDCVKVKVSKKFRVLRRSDTKDPPEVFKFKLIFSFSTKDKFGSIECKRVRDYKPLKIRSRNIYNGQI